MEFDRPCSANEARHLRDAVPMAFFFCGGAFLHGFSNLTHIEQGFKTLIGLSCLHVTRSGLFGMRRIASAAGVALCSPRGVVAFMPWPPEGIPRVHASDFLAASSRH